MISFKEGYELGKVLVSFVGEQDPYSEKTDTEGAIVTLAKYLHPKTIFMLPTKRMPDVKSETESHANSTREWLTTPEYGFSQDNIYITPLPLTDPRSIPQLLELGSEEIKRIIGSLNPQEDELIINTSSGTPQMQSCWYIWANSGLFAPCKITLYQVSHPDYAESDEDRIEQIEVEFMEETNTIKRIEDYLDSAMFQVAGEEAKKLSKISSYSNRRMKAEIIRELCFAYHHWDLMNYGEARNKLSKIASAYERAIDMHSLISLLKDQLEMLNQLKRGEKENIYTLTDIYYNARRRFKQHGYADTLARVWRVIEGCLYYRLRNTYDIEPRDIANSNNTDNKNKILDHVNVNRELSFFRSVQALEEAMNDTSFIAFKTTEQEFPWGNNYRTMSVSAAIEEIRDKRNKSVVAHGTAPVSQDIARLALEMGKLFLDFTFRDQSFIDSYPFKGSESRSELTKIMY